MFELRGVRFHTILNIPTLKIEEGKITTLVGKSGSGKTTLLRMLNKIISPTEGEIFFESQELSTLNTIDHRRKVTMLSQNPVVFGGTIRDNLTIGLKYQERHLPCDRELEAILKQVCLPKALDFPVEKMSGGEKQRMALGRILLLNSRVYLMDEPSSALDENTEDVIIRMITRHVRKMGNTLVMVTHSKGAARKYSDTIITVAKGHCTTEVNQ